MRQGGRATATRQARGVAWGHHPARGGPTEIFGRHRPATIRSTPWFLHGARPAVLTLADGALRQRA